MLNQLFIPLASKLFQAMCAREYAAFRNSLAHPQAIQETVLRKLLKDLERTDYGKQYQINGDEDYTAFSEKLPIQTYDSFEPWIQRQLHSGQTIITPYPVLHVEPTSGSSGPVKRIPYTRPLIQSFTRMFQIWAYDQLKYGFQAKTGRIFMSISPPSGNPGFSDERDYLREPFKTLVSPFLVLPPRRTQALDFHKALALTLLQEERLEIISIWSPSYLLALLAYIDQNRDELAALLPASKRMLGFVNGVDWQAVWPHLKLISCWDNALAEPLAKRIRTLFPNVQVQGKGLLATEAPMTVPLVGVEGHLPLVGELFMEFEMPDGDIKQLHELQQGDQAQLIITQQAGLTRYRINDLVEVHGFCQNTPTLVFMGRANQVSDLAGEKLHERFVAQALMPLLPSGCFLLVPAEEPELGYMLLIDTTYEELAEQADRALCQAYHYGQARYLGQLKPLRVVQIADLLIKLQAFYQSQGMKLGNIKDSALMTDPAQGKKLLAFLIDSPDKTLLPA